MCKRRDLERSLSASSSVLSSPAKSCNTEVSGAAKMKMIQGFGVCFDCKGIPCEGRALVAIKKKDSTGTLYTRMSFRDGCKLLLFPSNSRVTEHQTGMLE